MTNIIDDIIFEKYNEGKLSEDKMILLLEASNTNKEEIKRIKEKVKKKEKLTEAEKKKYEDYKKSRNKKIAIGVGIGAAGIATVATVNHRLKEEDRKLQEQIKRYHDHDEKEKKEREKERLEREEEKRRKQDELGRSRNDNADLIKQLQKESDMYYKSYDVARKLLEKIEKELNENEKEINDMRNKMGSNKLVDDVAYNTTITRLNQSREELYKIYRKTKDDLEKFRYEIDKREKKLEKFDL